MEPPSASPRRGGVHWQGSLLTVSLLIFWSPSIPAQPTIESVPLNAAEGNDVLLLLSNPPEDIFVYIWYKGESTGNNDRIVSYASQVQIQALGPAYTGRETIYHNGSLLIQNVTLNHSGVYTLQITTVFGPTEIAGQIRVYPALPTPFIISNSSNPVEDQDSVTLTCYPETQNTTYLWLINNQSLPETDRLELSSDNRTLTVYSVTRNDTGSYECRTRNEVNSRRSDPFILNVLYGPDTPTISPSYWYYPPGANLTLSCNVTSNPRAQYSWLINGTYLQSTQVLFIPNITASHSGNYTCHVHNNATGFNRTTVKSITVSELPTPFITSNHSNPVEDQDSVTLTCGPDTQDTTYLWLINNQSLPETDRLELSSDNRTLTVYSVTRNDTGPYECRTWNQVNARRSDPFILNVLYGPDTPTISPSYWYYPPGANLILSCNATSNPPAQYSWLINGTYLQSTQVLFIPNITPSHSGNYTCHVHNNATGFNRTTVKTITVSELPTPFITSNHSNPVEDQDSVTLTCGPDTQDTTYLWLINNQSLPETDRLELSSDNRTLTVYSVTRNDTGPYECRTWNQVNARRSDPFILNVLYGPDTPTISPSYWYYPPGANLILSCNATSNPPAQYSWLINGTYLQSTQVLFIPNITPSHSGNYTCHVHNNATGFNRTTVKTITVSELPTPFITSNHSNPVEDQDSVTLTCGPDTQDTTYLWLINNQSLPETDRLELSSDNRTLTVYSVTRNDTGPYECRTWNQVNARRSDPFILNVLYGPDTPTISPSYWYYPPGANLILSCNTTSNPPAQYSWLINGTYLQSTQVLFIPNITPSHSGNYTCHVHNNATGFNRTTVKTITVSELPTPFITSNHSNPVEDQDSVTLTCGPDTQDTTYLWLINNQSLPETDRLELSSDNRTLTVHSVTRNDTGPYECRTWNQVNARRSDPFILNVLYGPDTPTISPSYWYYPAGANLTLSCNTTSNPPAQYSWLINGNYLQSTQVLFIPSITVSGTGNYTCLVYNNATDFNRTTVKTITVYESVTKPSIQASSTTVTENEGPVTLTCLTNHAEISIRWIFKGQILPLTERTTLSQDNSSLTIDPIRREDTGEYQCEVYNPVSSNKSDPLNLTVTYPPPEIPGLSGGAIAGIVVGAVAVVAVVVALVYFLCIRNTARASDQRDNTEHKPSASNHSQDHSDTDNEVAYSSLNFKAQQPEKSTSAFPSPTATETIYSEVKKK